MQDRLAGELTIDQPAGDRTDLAPWGFYCDLRPQAFCCNQFGEQREANAGPLYAHQFVEQGKPVDPHSAGRKEITAREAHAVNPFFALSGFLVGALVGLTGVGGGSLMTPVLVFIFGVQATTAVGTDLLYAATTKTVGTVVHHRRGTIDWRVTRRLAIGSIPAAISILSLLYGFGGHRQVGREPAW